METTAGCGEISSGVFDGIYFSHQTPSLVMVMMLWWLKIRLEKRINYVPL
jgi:hypothetical protein